MFVLKILFVCACMCERHRQRNVTVIIVVFRVPNNYYILFFSIDYFVGLLAASATAKRGHMI